MKILKIILQMEVTPNFKIYEMDQERQTKFKMKFLKVVFVVWAVQDFLQEKNGLL